MTEDARLAFVPLEARAAALGDGNPADRISLGEHVVEVEIGAYQSERGITQRVRFDIVVELAAKGAGATDDVDRILSYEVLIEAVAAELAAERVNLLEALAERIATRVLRAPQAERVFVRIEKLDRGPFTLGVEIVRTRTGTAVPAPLSQVTEAPRPRVVFCPHDRACEVPALIDRLAQDGVPLVLCTGPAGADWPQAATSEARHRIGLLSVEQAAWSLASHDRRLTVAATRTELRACMNGGAPCVWAPFKIVLDAVEPPPTGAEDPLSLALWLAGLLAAVELVVVGADAPLMAPLPVRAVA
ncbi:MAG: dihydroneopterin aldolase [Rubellimicrobium sp.]|nr:dihydroneopterin aldolase [Rubellimicrobium sp.]